MKRDEILTCEQIQNAQYCLRVLETRDIRGLLCQEEGALLNQAVLTLQRYEYHVRTKIPGGLPWPLKKCAELNS